MKKIIYLIGAFVTTAAIVGAVAIMLNKLKISLSIEGIDDTLDEENAKNDIDLSIENEHDSTPSGETEKSVEEALSAMDEDESDVEKDIDVEISEE
ncbi:MAG: hypothetical protein ACOYIO_08475 [Eubacteriales bacterium]|jgi:hypothetical protein